MKGKTFIIIILLILIGIIIMAGINHERVVASRDKGLAEDWNADHEQTGNHDCEQNQFLNQVIENRVDFPAGPVEGQIIWRSDLNFLYVFDGTEWVRYSGIEKNNVVSTAVFFNNADGTYEDVTNMSINHASKTGHVLVLFSAWIRSELDNKLISIRLLKDGAPVAGTIRPTQTVEATDGVTWQAATSIMHLDLSAGTNTWKIQMQSSTADIDVYMKDKELIVIDIN